MRRKNNTTIILFSDRDNKYSITFNQPPQKAVFKYYKGMKNLIIKEETELGKICKYKCNPDFISKK